MNPVPVMQLVELIRGIATDEATYKALHEVVEKLGKTSASAEDFPAFIVNRILVPMINEAVYTLYEGVGNVKSDVLNRLWWGLDALPIGPDDVVMQKTPYTFDCSVPELFAPLAIGARVVVLADGGHLNPRQVADEIARTGTTMVQNTPSGRSS